MAKRKRRPVGETIGGILVGFDQQVFRSTPPAQELVQKGQPVRGLSGEDGGALEVVFPEDHQPSAVDPRTRGTGPDDGPSGP
jgi:hypothetical protein